MSGHTPGPWGVDREVVVDAEDCEVAVVTVAYREPEDWQAIAQLISAAPELYEALSMVLAYVARLQSAAKAGAK